MRADIFKLHSLIVDDYKSYIQSFININDPEIREVVENELSKGKLWPEPLIQFNPAFETYGEVPELVSNGDLAEQLSDVFRDDKSGAPYKLYKHQVDAIRLGTDGRDFIVTSGTGSGKTLTFIGTILNHLFETKSFNSGVQAVLVYPMNALINSQVEELDKYARIYEDRTGNPLPFRYASYTGQLKEDERVPWRENPPDLLLTNYMMLELILTRHREHALRDSIYSNLKYLVFDELHTYRGRQGADVGILIRRIRSRCDHEPVCIGTSATMVAGGGSVQEQKAEVASVASTVFGRHFEIDQIIQETLTRSFSSRTEIPEKSLLSSAVVSEIDRDADVETLKSHPTAVWLENKVALRKSDGELIRNIPRTFSEITSLLSEDSGREIEACVQHLTDLMDWINKVNERSTDPRYTYLPFKLHQFFAQTGSVYTSLAPNSSRHMTLEPGVYKSDSEGNKQPIFPNVFSRGSGYEFLCVYKDQEENQLIPREFNDRDREGKTCIPGYILTSEDVWDPERDLESLPDAWFKVARNGEVSVQKKYLDRMPQSISFDEWGRYSDSRSLEQKGWFIRFPLLFDPTSGQFFDPQTNESTKLTKLGSEGRSTSTTITAFSILTQLAESGFDLQDQKLLSFTDNRQDAALQAGHFNDFIKVIQLRSAIRKAVDSAPDSELTYKNLGDQIFEALSLEFREYANYKSDIDALPPPPVQQAYKEALKKYLVYLALYDLRRSWRVVLPNLEQCALLRVDYANLDDIAAWEEGWSPVPLLGQMDIRSRRDLLFQMLEFFRLEYAVYSENYLIEERIRENRKEIEEKLIAPWRFEQEDKIDPYYLRYDTLAPRTRLYTRSLGITSAFGKFIKQQGKQRDIQFSRDSYRQFLIALLDTLEAADYLKSRQVRNNEHEEVKVYQLKLDKIIWLPGDRETVIPDVIKQRAYKTPPRKPNRYFQNM